MMEKCLTAEKLEEMLGYRSKGCLVKTYLGDVKHPLEPSQPFLKRLEKIGFQFPEEEGDFINYYSLPSGTVAISEFPPGTVIVGSPKQCPECVAEVEEGKRHPTQTWYVFSHPQQKYCSIHHRRAWYRRNKKG
jgi:hypothetical protein